MVHTSGLPPNSLSPCKLALATVGKAQSYLKPPGASNNNEAQRGLIAIRFLPTLSHLASSIREMHNLVSWMTLRLMIPQHQQGTGLPRLSADDTPLSYLQINQRADPSTMMTLKLKLADPPGLTSDA